MPGLLYRKYKAMHNEGVSVVLQRWFFGGTPDLMNRAAWELSKCDFSEREDEFLLHRARRDWVGDAPVLRLQINAPGRADYGIITNQ